MTRLILLSIASFLMVLFVANITSAAQPMSFEKDWRRYPPPDVILRLLASKFPDVNPKDVPPKCVTLTKETRGALGDDMPVSGAPLTPKPTAALVDWLHSCIVHYVVAEDLARLRMDGAQLAERVGAEIWKACSAQVPNQPPHHVLSGCHWQQLAPASREKLIEGEILKVLGPDEVLAEFEIAASTQELRELLAFEIDEVGTSGSQRYALIGVIPQSGVTSLGQAMKLNKYLMLLTDWLRY